MNPYDWQRQDPEVEVPRALLDEVVSELRSGHGVVVIGGRGMGKSVFLHQLRSKLQTLSHVGVLTFSTPPFPLTAQRCLETLARELEVPASEALSTLDLLKTRLSADAAPRQLALLFDEFDHYAQTPEISPSASPGRYYFNNLEAARRNLSGAVGICAVGSIGTFVFRDVLGSNFLARATWFWLTPFRREEILDLARPLSDHGEQLSDEVIDALLLASGGHPALVTYGLQQMWREPPAAPAPVSERDVVDSFELFRQRHGEFFHDVEKSVSDPALSQAPRRVWELIQRRPGDVPRGALKEACEQVEGALELNVADVLNLLQAAGLVRIDGSVQSDDPLAVSPVASILSLPTVSAPDAEFRGRLYSDLETLLGKLHASSADFFRPGGKGTDQQLVPESVFAAFLALGFRLLGWRVEREAQYAAGRTDLKLAHNGYDELAIIVVKIWGRNDYREAHHQVEDYWSTSVAAGAVVMIHEGDGSEWPATYRQKCLSSAAITVEEIGPDAPVAARFRCTSTTAGGFVAQIDHFLLRLERRRKRGL